MKNLLIIIFVLFFFFISSQPIFSAAPPVTRNISVSVEVLGTVVIPPGGGGAFIPSKPPSTVIFKGMAYPGAFITLLKNSKVTSTTTSNSNGDFILNLTGISPGTWNFSIFAEDTEKRKSVTLGFSVSIIEGTQTTISDIYISPTIALTGSLIKKGESLNIKGQAYPDSDLNIFISSPKTFVEKSKVPIDGKWGYSFDTNPLEIGSHSVKVKSITSFGNQSQFSEELAFSIFNSCQGADLNFDGNINLVDFSILLYFWEQSEPANVCADINSDQNVNLTDFSIMMYWWSQ